MTWFNIIRDGEPTPEGVIPFRIEVMDETVDGPPPPSRYVARWRNPVLKSLDDVECFEVGPAEEDE